MRREFDENPLDRAILLLGDPTSYRLNWIMYHVIKKNSNIKLKAWIKNKSE
jgi:hypothetical protein